MPEHKIKFLPVILVLLFLSTNPSLAQTDSSKWFSFHFQQTTVYQWHYQYHAAYSGDYSLSDQPEDALSITSTIFLSASLWKNAKMVFNPELAGGSGLSKARGIAGFTNGETFRIGDPSPQPYIARGYLEQKFPLTKKTVWEEDGVNTPQRNIPVKYISVILGKFSLADFFDNNSYSHDPRSQFLNWSLMSAGAWDYPANTRGYTIGGIIQYVSPQFSCRYSLSEEPTYANGPVLNANIQKYQGHTAEVEKPIKISKRDGKLRLLGFYNISNSASYAEATKDSAPDLVARRGNGARGKYGFALGYEQELNDHAGLFARLSWNDGKNETWAFTEIDQSICLGAVTDGTKWKRPEDKVGFAIVMNGISKEHRNYLNAGGYGFMIGDSKLTNYAPEAIAELYYSYLLHEEHFWLTPNYQLVINPAYNRDRGPVNVFGVRLHVEF